MDEIRKKAEKEGIRLCDNVEIHAIIPTDSCTQCIQITDTLEPLYRRISELETVLDAWHNAFKTSQLTHALARLESAEDKVKRIEAKLAKAVETLKGEMQINYEFCYHKGSCGAEINNCYAQHIYKALKEIEGAG